MKIRQGFLELQFKMSIMFFETQYMLEKGEDMRAPTSCSSQRQRSKSNFIERN